MAAAAKRLQALRDVSNSRNDGGLMAAEKISVKEVLQEIRRLLTSELTSTAVQVLDNLMGCAAIEMPLLVEEEWIVICKPVIGQRQSQPSPVLEEPRQAVIAPPAEKRSFGLRRFMPRRGVRREDAPTTVVQKPTRIVSLLGSSVRSRSMGTSVQTATLMGGVCPEPAPSCLAPRARTPEYGDQSSELTYFKSVQMSPGLRGGSKQVADMPRDSVESAGRRHGDGTALLESLDGQISQAMIAKTSSAAASIIELGEVSLGLRGGFQCQ
eukprot:TRINITY_DN60342_c0_g1_i1.p1 TRINITY_DN60342_c0_g1~~TRINITY_DN60342_c0_g1_i1.p1  ORF type:complete len:306 (+),score=34.42 TRINITY_DN60342_c0_g1_i1:115-918(+)